MIGLGKIYKVVRPWSKKKRKMKLTTAHKVGGIGFVVVLALFGGLYFGGVFDKEEKPVSQKKSDEVVKKLFEEPDADVLAALNSSDSDGLGTDIIHKLARFKAESSLPDLSLSRDEKKVLKKVVKRPAGATPGTPAPKSATGRSAVQWTPKPASVSYSFLATRLMKIFNAFVDLEAAKEQVARMASAGEDNKMPLVAPIKTIRSTIHALHSGLMTFVRNHLKIIKSLLDDSESEEDNAKLEELFSEVEKNLMKAFSPKVILEMSSAVSKFAPFFFPYIFPLLTPLPSFSTMAIDDDVSLIKAHLAVSTFLATGDEANMEEDVLETLKKIISSATFISALEKIYAEEDFQVLLKAQTKDEVYAALKHLSMNQKNLPVLVLLTSATEEGIVRILKKLLDKLRPYLKEFDGIITPFKTFFSKIQTMTYTTDVSAEVKSIFEQTESFSKNFNADFIDDIIDGLSDDLRDIMFFLEKDKKISFITGGEGAEEGDF